jgi:L-fuculose-phosphate aldolase
MRYVDEARSRVLVAAQDMRRRGLVEGTAGNISARQQDGTIVITPASVDYADMRLDDLVTMDAGGTVLAGQDGRSPSSEVMLHLACYQAFDHVGSVVHSHPIHATMFAVAHQAIPAGIDEFAMYVGGDVRCTEYAPSGSAEVGVQAVKALVGRGAAVIANHGLVAVGPDPGAALHISALVERCARIVWGARALGRLHPLPVEVNDRFAGDYAARRQEPLSPPAAPADGA